MVTADEQNTAEIRVYLDHSMLDVFEKSGMAADFRSQCPDHWQFVYSDETLREFSPPEYIESFCRVLDDLGAARISINVAPSEGGSEFNVDKVDPRDVLNAIGPSATGRSASPPAMAGFWNFAAKAYGNLPDMSFSDVFDSIQNEVEASMETALDHARKSDIKFTPELEEQLSQVEEFLHAGVFKRVWSDAVGSIDSDLPKTTDDKTGETRQMSPLEAFQQQTKLSPANLNNLRGKPGVVAEIERLQAQKLGVPIGQGPIVNLLNGENVRTQADRVNLLYNWLNFSGYRRDKGVRGDMGAYSGFWSDMTHVCYASYCHLLITRDTRQADKATAVYEYLGIPTQVLHVKAG